MSFLKYFSEEGFPDYLLQGALFWVKRKVFRKMLYYSNYDEEVFIFLIMT